jgi:L-ascorbate metabolism protein UlaG (beta-lactamase superfamily)
MAVVSAIVAALWTDDASAQTVKVTPLGSHTGELCQNDRALLFEDPTGVRILYDVGMTIAGGNDPRLGDVHVVLLSHAHPDHIGGQKAAGINAGTCRRPDTESAAPNSNTVEIAAAKNAALIVSRAHGIFLARKIENIRGVPTPNCPADGLAREMTIPQSVPCVGNLQLGGKRSVKRTGQTTAVQIALVPAFHSNFALPNMLTGSAKAGLTADSLPAYVGDANGYILVFTNGLRVYLSGDTAIYGDMKNIIKDFYRVNLAVMNIGAFSMQGEEAAFAVDNLIQPAAVILSHVDEAATDGGVVRAGTKTKQFIDLVKKSQVHVPRSGHMMEFTGDANCVSGCFAEDAPHRRGSEPGRSNSRTKTLD